MSAPRQTSRRSLRAGLSLLVSLFALGISGGCASGRFGEQPEVTVGLVDLRPLESTTFESKLGLVVRLTNPSTETFTFRGGRHRLRVNGHELGVAVTSTPVELPALTTVTHEASFHLGHLALIPVVNELRRDSVAVYELESTYFREGIGARGLTVRQRGEIDLSALARLPGAGAMR